VSVLRADAPAKINRELRVGPRRDDGYHPILSRFTSIDLADTLIAEPADALELSVEGAERAGIASDPSNLVWRAARLLAGRLGPSPGARIRLVKRIPAGAGLGGGSADAAVALLLLSRLWNLALTQGELEELASRLGSDVPYFLTGGEADIAGRGDVVTPREDGSCENLFLLIPPFSMSTAEVYALYDRVRGDSGWTLPTRLDVETSGRFFGPNDLASAMLKSTNEMTAYLRAAAQDVSDCCMTGSGSAIVLRGLSPEDAEALLRRHPECRLLPTRTIGRDEYQRRIQPSGGPSWT